MLKDKASSYSEAVGSRAITDIGDKEMQIRLPQIYFSSNNTPYGVGETAPCCYFRKSFSYLGQKSNSFVKLS